jgi:hypothetical protein
LGEGNSVDHVLDQFDSLFQSGDFDGGLVVFVSPGGVFGFSLGSSGGDGVNGFFVVVLGLGQIDFSLLQDVFVVFNA